MTIFAGVVYAVLALSALWYLISSSYYRGYRAGLDKAIEIIEGENEPDD